MSKHTPGPWQVTCIDGRTVEVVIHHVLRIASCGPKDDPENRANAALIACAPEMLLELGRVSSLLESIERETGYCTAATQSGLAKLIAKAEGQE